MIKIIVGKKGSGKTKKLVDLINRAATESSGIVVCIEKGLKLTYDLDHSVRLIDSDAYHIEGYPAFYGFLAGVMSCNYDITDIFVDATLRIGGRDLNDLCAMLQQLEKLTDGNDLNITFTVSCDPSELPEAMRSYVI